MELHTYLAFIVASLILCVVPGPDMLYMIGRSVVNGRRAGVYAAIGVNAGAYVHLVAAVAGLTAILATSAIAFTLVKWAGAMYLLYLGVKILVSKGGELAIEGQPLKYSGNKEIFWQGFLSDVLNPKVALFYVSILPQFINPRSGDPVTQLILLGVTLNIIGIVTNLLYVYFAAALTERLRESTKLHYWLNKALGSLFIALGLKLAGEKQI